MYIPAWNRLTCGKSNVWPCVDQATILLRILGGMMLMWGILKHRQNGQTWATTGQHVTTICHTRNRRPLRLMPGIQMDRLKHRLYISPERASELYSRLTLTKKQVYYMSLLSPSLSLILSLYYRFIMVYYLFMLFSLLLLLMFGETHKNS